MRAVQYRRIGEASDVLELVEVEDPHPGPGEVRVRLSFSGVNPTDWKRRRLGPLAPGPAQIPHQDGSGHIDEVGPDVGADRLGQAVWVYHAAWNSPGGTAAEYVCVPAQQAIALPDGVDAELAASLGVSDAVISGEERRRVTACLGGLTDVQRECIELAYYQGLTYVQVSEKLSANLATIKSRMRDALRGLRNCLGVG